MPRRRRRRPARAQREPAASETGNDSESPVTVTSDELERAVARYMEQHLEISAIVAEQYAGPLPHPKHLEQFETVQPGAADRVIRMAEQQLAHRQELESRVVESSLKREATGQWFAFCITLAIVGGGFYVISQGYSIGGLVPMIGAIATLAGVFIYGKRKSRKDRSGSVDRKGKDDLQPNVPKLVIQSEEQGASSVSEETSKGKH